MPSNNIMKIFAKVLTVIALALVSAGCQRNGYSWENDLQHRLANDFCRSRADVEKYIRKYIPDVTESQIDEWTANGKLESMVIDGERRYFHNAAPNLFRIDSVCREIKASIDGVQVPAYMTIGERSIDLAREEADSGNVNGNGIGVGKRLGQPVRMRVRYTLTVDADAVPDGKTIRCWLPFPRKDVDRQTDVKFIKAGWRSWANDTVPARSFVADRPDCNGIVFSSETCPHSTLYMEAPSVLGCETEFYEEFEYTSRSEVTSEQQIKRLAEACPKPAPEEYTGEREAHVKFSPRILSLRDSLSAGLTAPYDKALAFYTWIYANFPWASAREYSTIENIPEYVLDNGHGDCGQVSLLFITLCRSAGIPARFQSGFMMHPGSWNLHDWAEIWMDGYGWMPVDQSFGGDHYFGNIDSYRMVVNNDFGRRLEPEKKYPRSETVDFQRGEVEWQGGNLYFDQWRYRMNIEYL